MTSFTCLEVARAAKLAGERPRGKERAFCCPNHEDTHPSLTINPDKNAWLCGPCGRSGTAWQLAAFLSGHDPGDKPPIRAWLTERGLLSNNNGPAPTTSTSRHKRAPRAKASSRDDRPIRTIDRTFDYCDAAGVLRYQTVKTKPRGFYQRRPDGRGGWINNLDAVERLPFALERLVDSTPDVFVTEGEKDAEACWTLGIRATCNVGGAKKWHDDDSRLLIAAANVQRAYVVPDHDEPGHQHAEQVAQSLYAAGVKVRVLALPGLHDGPPPPNHGRDISDWFEMHTADELKAIAIAAPVWTPQTPPAPPAPTTPSHWQRLDLVDLTTWPCEPLEPIVDKFFARRSLVYVGAETLTGKTLLFQHIMWLCVHGGRLFDQYAVTPVERVAYLVLEDPARRIQDRLLDMAKEFPDPIARDRCVVHIAPGFTLTGEPFWEWLEHIIGAERRQLVILDTYQKATPGLESFDDKAQGPILHRLAELTRRFDVTIIVIDHLRKQTNGGKRRGEITIDDIKGSGGKAQNADAVILLARTPDRRQLKVFCTGKDFDEPVRILVRVAPKGSADPKFTYVGELEALGNAKSGRSEATRKRILEAMPPLEAQTKAPELAGRLELAESTVKTHLKHLISTGKVKADGERQFRRYWRVADDDGAGKSATDADEG